MTIFLFFLQVRLERKNKVLQTITNWKATLEETDSWDETSSIIEFVEMFDQKSLSPVVETIPNQSPHPVVGNCLFPKLNNKRKRERASSVFPKPTPKRRSSSTTSPTTSSIQELISECATSDLTDACWMYLASLKQAQVFQSLLAQTAMDPNSFLEKYELARSIWTCFLCKNLEDIEKNLSGFAMCDICLNWFHCSCIGQSENELKENVTNWCPNCK